MTSKISERRKSGLFLCFEFDTWKDARMWSYVSGLMLFHDAQAEFDCELQLLQHKNHGSTNETLIRKSIEGRRFDFAVVWLPHADISRVAVEALEKACDFVIFFLVESLIYTAQDIAELPHLERRWREVTSLLTTTSHVICMCPVTYRELQRHGYRTTFVFGITPMRIPEWARHDGPTMEYAFAASLYNDSRLKAAAEVEDVARSLGLKKLDVKDGADLVLRFNEAMLRLRDLDQVCAGSDPGARSRIADEVATIRRELWWGYLRQLSKADFVVTLASYFKGTPGRVIEAHACGVPVVFFDTNLVAQDVDALDAVGGISFATAQNLHAVVSQFYVGSQLDIQSNATRRVVSFPTVIALLDEVLANPKGAKVVLPDTGMSSMTREIGEANARRIVILFENEILMPAHDDALSKGARVIRMIDSPNISIEECRSLAFDQSLEGPLRVSGPMGDPRFLFELRDRQFLPFLLRSHVDFEILIYGGRCCQVMAQYYIFKRLVRNVSEIAVFSHGISQGIMGFHDQLADKEFDGNQHNFRTDSSRYGFEVIVE